jgi:hypothetical protein
LRLVQFSKLLLFFGSSVIQILMILHFWLL